MITEKEYKTLMKRKKISIISDIILIIFIIGLIFYLFIEIESVKLLSSDVCKICFSKNPDIIFYELKNISG